MPNARRYNRRYRRRRTGRRSRYSSYIQKGLGALSLARSAYRGVQYIKGLVNSELFKYDQTQTGVSLTNSGGVLHLTSLAQGNTDTTRTGNSIYVRAVNIKGVLNYNSVGTVFAQPCRLMVVIDTQQIGDTSPSAANMLEQATTYGHLNSDTVGRFKVIFNRVYNLNSGSNTCVPFEINLPMRHHVRYNGTTVSDVQKGGLYFVYMSNLASSTPTMDYEARLSYHDN